MGGTEDTTNEGLAAACARGRVGGRPTVATDEVIRAARDPLPDPGLSIVPPPWERRHEGTEPVAGDQGAAQ